MVNLQYTRQTSAASTLVRHSTTRTRSVRCTSALLHQSYTLRGTRHSQRLTPTLVRHTQCRPRRFGLPSSVFSHSSKTNARPTFSTERFKHSHNQTSQSRQRRCRRLRLSGEKNSQLQHQLPHRQSARYRPLLVSTRRLWLQRLQVRPIRIPHVPAIGQEHASDTTTPATGLARSSRSKASLTTVSSFMDSST
jgi:hypothetical protein